MNACRFANLIGEAVCYITFTHKYTRHGYMRARDDMAMHL